MIRTTTVKPLRAILCAASLGCALSSQDLRVLDPSGYGAAAYDIVRARTVAIGRLGETREFDGTAWHVTPDRPFDSFAPGAMAYDVVNRRMLALGGSWASTRTWFRQGLQWHEVVPPVTPPARGHCVLEFDWQRSEFVLFGGLDQQLMPLDDTWTFDGATWTQRPPTTSPSPRFGASAAYDSQRGVVRLFGGSDYLSLPDDTWEWDGTNWNLVPTTSQPPGRYAAGMAYDPVRDRTVLFGGEPGFNTDVWEFDGTTWQFVTPTSPGHRVFPHLVYDFALGKCLMLGGRSGGEHLDTWSWDGSQWLLLDAPLPHETSDAQLFAHPDGVRIGRIVGVPWSPGTQVFDGTRWSDVPGATPPALVSQSRCTGPVYAYAFGGFDTLTGLDSAGFHAFDGSVWTTLPSGPGAREGAALAYDEVRQQVVLFGGFTQSTSGPYDDETWTFDGVAWTQHTPSIHPGARGGATMAFDRNRGAAILVGGFGGGQQLGDTWEWNGSSWTQLPVGPVPGLSARAFAAFDERRNALTLVAGRPTVNYPNPIDAWTLGSNGWTPLAAGQLQLGSFVMLDQVVGAPYSRGLVLADSGNQQAMLGLSTAQAEVTNYGSGCTAAAPQLTADRYPQPGTANLAIEVIGAPVQSLAALLGATSSASIAFGGCTLLVPTGQLAVVVPTSPGGTAQVGISVPNSQTFLGVQLFFQAATLSPTAPGGFTLSAGLRLAIGD
ncbi:MAG: kelch repeat-containing protein [Planctomycetota bacterium]